MVFRSIVFSAVLLFALSAAPLWALDDPSDEAIEMIETERPLPAESETATSPPMSTIKLELPDQVPEKHKAAPSMPVDAGGTEVPTKNSWWNSLCEIVGLADSDKGETVQPSTSRMALSASDYIIGPGDVIGVSVWRDENLTRTVVVLPDGKISFPLLGELVAGGKSVSKLKQELETGLSRYISDTSVTVEVKQSNSMIIYIIGRVNAPGRQLLVANTNVLQALAMAGGMNPFAKKGKVKIYRQEEGKTAMFSFNYDEVLEGRHLETNIVLKRGDVIIVP